jgi:hypothetical protein
MIDALPLLLGPEGYQISRSVRFRSSASATFTRTPSVDGNRKKWTWSAWVKLGALGSLGHLMSCTSQSGNDGIAAIYFSGNQLVTYYDTNTTNPAGAVGPAVYRDPSAWYHIVWAVDAANSIHYVYVNNVLVSTDTSKYPVNYDYAMNRAGYVQNMGAQAWGPTNYFDGYMTEVNFIDGQALDPLSFGETDAVTGVWKPKKYAGTYGTNGFFLNFADNSAATAVAIGKDSSGNGNNWTPNNISVTAGVTYDSMLDVPTQWADGGNGRGNYAVLSPIDNNNGTLSNGNLNLSIPAGVSSSGFGNFAMTAGKWYWEVIPTNGSVFAPMVGVSDQSAAATNRTYATTNGWGYYSNAQTYYNNTPASYGATFTTNDVIGVAYDADTGSLSFYKNGVSQGVAFSTNLFGKPIIPAFFNGTSSNAQTFAVNFGQRPFAYTPPTGFKALNTLNLPTPTILKGNQYMNATLWNGNSTNATVITTTLGTVDFAWVKKRNGIDDHRLANTVTGGNKHLKSNTTEAESTATTVIQAFSGSTFTLGTDNSVNATGGTYVGWTWQAGGAAVTNTAGTITSTVSVGATQGFSVVTYTGNGTSGATIGHGLGVAPTMIIVKDRANATSWGVYHSALGNTGGLYLQGTNAFTVSSAFWNNTSPTSTVFCVSNNNINNQASDTYVAYCFAAVAGYSSAFSYTGNGSTDGPFIFLGFRPRWIMWKKTNSSTNAPWVIVDTARSPYNLAREYLLPNASDAETSVDLIDILSNGFKWRGTAPGGNNSGDTYIGFAMAESPFKFSLGR